MNTVIRGLSLIIFRCDNHIGVMLSKRVFYFERLLTEVFADKML